MNSPGEFVRKTNAALLGKTVASADVSGHAVRLKFTDGTEFDYDASDGGYSCWDVKKDGRQIV